MPDITGTQLINRAINELIDLLSETGDPATRQALERKVEQLKDRRTDLVTASAAAQALALADLTNTLAGVVADLQGNVPGHLLDGLRGVLGDAQKMAGQAGAEIRLPRSEPADAASGAASVSLSTPLAAGTAAGTAAAGSVGTADWGAVVDTSTKFADIRAEYDTLLQTCVIDPGKTATIDLICSRIAKGETRYRAVSDRTGVPWWVVAIIHAMEGSLNFSTHLCNGDPLSARTTNHPPGRPKDGQPPFDWADSAVDAIQYDKLDQWGDWSPAGALYAFESFNGFGYRKIGRATPYLWGFTNHHLKGKYVRDRVFDPEAVTRQPGAAAIMLRAQKLQVFSAAGASETPATPGPAAAAAGSVTPAAMVPAAPAAADVSAAVRLAVAASPLSRTAQDELAFPGLLREGDGIGSSLAGVRRVQEWCCFHGFETRIDGEFGRSTATVLQRFQEVAGLAATGVVDAATWAALTRPMLGIFEPLPFGPDTGLDQAILQVAERHLKAGARELGGENRGPWVRLYMDGSDGTELSWCAGFASFVVEQAAIALGRPMPFRRRVGVAELRKDAKADRRLITADRLASPADRLDRVRPGMLYVENKDTGSNFSHTAIVVCIAGETFDTIEGNTGDGSSVERVARKNRGYKNREFVALTQL
ncbi:peptidoglycan-binding protein [Azospirillum sp.]|uniref:peptidoglycan-binding protein n=1 Tax=Azospirillum sp. TaxID=34012 RepID=UPI003D722E0E